MGWQNITTQARACVFNDENEGDSERINSER